MPRHPSKPPDEPITHLIVGTSSSNEHDNGDCDYCLVPVNVEYISYLLGLMDEVRRMHRADNAVYSLKCWDGSPGYFRDNDKLGALRDVDGTLAGDVPEGDPILLAVDPKFSEDDFQGVDGMSVQILSEDLWWIAYVKNSNIRIESAHVEKKTLLKILRSLGAVGESRRQVKAKPVPLGIRRIHDLLYLDIRAGKRVYDPQKSWSPDTMAAIAEVVAEFIPPGAAP